MNDVKFHCSAVGKLMTEPTAAAAKAGEVLSVGAKTHIRELVAQAVLGIDFEVSAKQMEKGIEVEAESIALVARVRGLTLAKNTERRQDEYLTGEADVFDPASGEGRDVKSSWSAASFPICALDCEDKVYEWQMRAYMRLWNAPRWHVDYCLVNTPERLIGFEPVSMHFFDHIHEPMRVTTWTIERDMALEARMIEKIKAARLYYAQVVAEFHRTHSGGPVVANVAAPPAPRTSAAPAELPASIFE